MKHPSFLLLTLFVICAFISCRVDAIQLERNEKMWPEWDSGNLYPDVSYTEWVKEMKDNFILQILEKDKYIQNKLCFLPPFSFEQKDFFYS